MNNTRKLVQLALLSFVFIFNANGRGIRLEFGQRFPLPVRTEYSLLSQWERKPVLDSLLIEDMEQDSEWQATGIAECYYTEEHAVDGRRSLRFRTSLVDTAYYRLPMNRTPWNSFKGEQGGYASVGRTFEKTQDWSQFNRLSFWVYIHPTSNPIYCFFLELENEGTDYNSTTSRKHHFVQDLVPGQWNHVLWEIPHLERDKVKKFNIIQTLIGHTPEGESVITYDFDRFQLQKVETDNFEGWDLPSGKFSFSHIGYRPEDKKIAMIGHPDCQDFQLLDVDGKIAFQGSVVADTTKNGIFHLLDFSNFREEGTYRLQCGTNESLPFPIEENIWLSPLFSGLNFYFCQRCGYDVPGIHQACHKDWFGFHGNERKVINGGWHDAADLSQGYWRTAMGVYALLSNLELIRKDKALAELSERMHSEIKWGIDWLLNTRFEDGYHMSWSVMRIYTDNLAGTLDDNVSQAQKVPWENFLGAAVECKAAGILVDSDPELSKKLLACATEDWEFAFASQDDWGRTGYQEGSWGAIASVLLYRATGEERYKAQALHFGKLLVQCQEQSFINDMPVTGFFYYDTSRRNIIHNTHAAFEEAAMIAFRELCDEFKEDENWMNWYASAVLYSDYFMKWGSRVAAPYDLLPNSVYSKSSILAEKDSCQRRQLLKQYNEGTVLNEEYALRTFPIWENELFHGSTNAHLSATWALAEASLLRNDTLGMQLVTKQLQWIFGNNPFGQSLMYGVGYDYAPLYAYCTKNIVGALPVGMDCMTGDDPYWSSSNYATYKELWIEPVNRFMGGMAAYLRMNQLKPDVINNIQINVEKRYSGVDGYRTVLTMKGVGCHKIEVKAFNAKVGFNSQSVDFRETELLELNFSLIDNNKPYVLLIIVDDKFGKEIVGVNPLV